MAQAQPDWRSWVFAATAMASGLIALSRQAFCTYALVRDPKSRIHLADQVDVLAAGVTGLRPALAVALARTFWIIADWPHGSTGTILAALATSRLATMGRAIPLAIATAFIFSSSAIPAFVVIAPLLRLTSGFPGFTPTVGPGLLLCPFSVLVLPTWP